MTVIKRTEEKIPSGESIDNVYYMFNFYFYDSYCVILITLLVIVLILC